MPRHRRRAEIKPVSLGAWPSNGVPSRFVWILPYRYREPAIGQTLKGLGKLLRAFASGWRLAAGHERDAHQRNKQVQIAIAIEDAATLLEQVAFRDFESKEA